MASPISLTDPAEMLIADASAVINLIASGAASQILAAMPMPVVVTDSVPRELETGRPRGRLDADRLQALIAKGLIGGVTLDAAAEAHFEWLVIGPAAMTLDDGEAATIAYAVANGGIAVIDERKANRICAEHFFSLRLACSVDLFAQEAVLQALGREQLAEAVVNALQVARMRVPPQYEKWVLDLIGPRQAARCSSLPRSMRAVVV